MSSGLSRFPAILWSSKLRDNPIPVGGPLHWGHSTTLAQQTNQCVQPIATRPRVSQQPASNVVQAQHLIQFPEQQQSAIRADLRAVKFQTHPTVKTEPNIIRFARTLRVIHEASLLSMLTF